MQCLDGKWIEVHVDCWPIFCPHEVPTQGEPCCSQSYAPDCTFGSCNESGASYTKVGCIEGKWEVTEVPCQGPVDCGGTTCDADSVCVETVGGAGFSYACQPYPCGPGALSCGCAASLCGGSGCSVPSAGLVSCTCSNCP
jgi:hypothetical protein